MTDKGEKKMDTIENDITLIEEKAANHIITFLINNFLLLTEKSQG